MNGLLAEYEPVMKELIRTVVRMFYEQHHVVLTDILLDGILLSDSEFCEKMKMLNREFNRIIMRLKDDKLIKQNIKVEMLENNRQNLKTVYFFNYSEVRSIIKYKIYKMTKGLETNINESDGLFYCQECDRRFSALDAQASMDGYVFKCQYCGCELVENPVGDDKSEMNLRDLLHKLERIIELLKRADSFDIPSLDYFQVLEMKKGKEEAKKEIKEKKEEKEEEEEMVNEEPVRDDEDYESTESCKRDMKNKDDEGDEVVYVSGKRRKYSEITDADIESMNEEEYTRYFDLYTAKNG